MLTDSIYRSLDSIPELQRQFKRVVLKLPHRQRLVEHFGQKLWVDPSELHGFYLYYEHEYDDYIFNFLSTQLSKYRRVLDLGANIGIYSVFFAARVERVDAFEPEPSVREKLKVNLQMNGLNNITIHKSCVGKISGNITFTPPQKNNQGIGKVTNEVEQGIELPCISLDDFLGEPLQEACLIKMDIEGAEWLALQGSQRILSQRQAPLSILLEVHPEEVQDLGGTVTELKSLLENLGLQVWGLTSTGLEPLVLDLSTDKQRFWWATSENI
jgi:FkbM family methyltransferase